jgi:hypothetical protein
LSDERSDEWIDRPRKQVEEAGIAPASRNPQAAMQQQCCVDAPPRWLHTACTDPAVRELDACWRQLTSDVRVAITEIVRATR